MRRIWLAPVMALTLVACGGGSSGGREEARTFQDLSAFNSKLAMYQPLHDGFVPQMGTHYGAPGPHLTVVLAHDDVISAFELIVPEEAGWYPWFDQPEGEPTTIEGLGAVYTQHVYVTERSSVVEGQRPVLLDLNLDALTAANPALQQYEAISPYVPGMGIHHGVPGPAVIMAVSEEGAINAFEIISPADQGWFEWFDQPEGEPMTIEGLGEVYTQHLYVVDRALVD